MRDIENAVARWWQPYKLADGFWAPTRVMWPDAINERVTLSLAERATINRLVDQKIASSVIANQEYLAARRSGQLTRILLEGYLHNVFAILLLVAFSLTFPWRKPPAKPFTPRCTSCGYDLTNLSAARCPECGHPYPTSTS